VQKPISPHLRDTRHPWPAQARLREPDSATHKKGSTQRFLPTQSWGFSRDMRLGCCRGRARATRLGACSRRARASPSAINPSTARQRRRRAHGPVCGLELLGVRPHLHPSAHAVPQTLGPARVALPPTQRSERAERGQRFCASAAVGGSHRQHGGRGAGCGGGGGGCFSDVGRPSARILRIATHAGEKRSSTPTPPPPDASTFSSKCFAFSLPRAKRRRSPQCELCRVYPAASPRDRTAAGPRRHV
jgi:hypothetical protein